MQYFDRLIDDSLEGAAKHSKLAVHDRSVTVRPQKCSQDL
jgi:hypothetical protein